jgi:hypothetical protein
MIRSLEANLLETPYRSLDFVDTTPSPSSAEKIPYVEWKFLEAPVLPTTNEYPTSTEGSPHECVKWYFNSKTKGSF